MGDQRKEDIWFNRPGGRTYRTWWCWTAGVIGGLAALAAVVLADVDQIWAAVVVGLALGTCAACIYDLPKETITARSALAFAGYGCAGAVTTLGLDKALGYVGLLIVLALAATSPAALGLASRMIKTTQQPQEEPYGDDEDQRLLERQLGRLEDTDTAALLRGWRASSAALARTGSRADWMSLTRQREAYLDELERRDPGHFAAWLESGPRAGDDPTSFFQDPGDQPTPA